MATPRMLPPLRSRAARAWRTAPRRVRLAWITRTVPSTTAEQVPGEPTESLALEQTDFLVQGEDLIAQITLKDRLGKRTGVHLYLYGYQPGTAFAELPKVDVDISPLGNRLVNINGKRTAEHGVRFESVANRLFVRVPLRLLGA